jgi:hypothetical protein
MILRISQDERPPLTSNNKTEKTPPHMEWKIPVILGVVTTWIWQCPSLPKGIGMIRAEIGLKN